MISLPRKVWNFTRHFLEMCISMCVAGNILILLVFSVAAALIGTPIRQQFPELSLFLIAFNLTLPMVVWMRFRGMEWRPTLEMAGSAFAVVILLIGLVWLNLVSSSILQMKVGSFCGLVCAGMFAVMLFRLNLYTSNHGSHQHPTQATS